MEYRPLGRTGVQVSPLCLGTMMFGAWGNTDHDDSIRIIHRALDAGINFVDTADVYSAGESEEIVGKALEGPPRRRRAGDEVLRARWARTPTSGGVSRRWIITEVENSLRRLGTDWIDLYQMHRPTRTPTSTRRSARSPTSCSRARSATSAPRRSPPARSSRRNGRPASAAWSGFAPSSRRTRSSCAASSSTCCPPRQRHGMGILTYSPLAGGWLSGSWSADSSPTSPARQRLAARFDMALPENQRKLEAVEQLAKVADEAGVPLIELAIAFVVNHPAVTSAIIGPRTMEQLDSQLPAAERRAGPGDPRPHRRDRRAGRQPQPRRHQLRRAGARATAAPAIDSTAAAARPRHGGSIRRPSPTGGASVCRGWRSS